MLFQRKLQGTVDIAGVKVAFQAYILNQYSASISSNRSSYGVATIMTGEAQNSKALGVYQR